MFTKKNHKIHIVIKDHVFRFIESTQANLESLQTYGERYLPPGVIREGKIIERETLTMILSEIIDELKLRGRKVQFFVPDAYVVIRKIQIPVDIPDDEIMGYLFLELGESIHLPFEDPQFDYSIVQKGEEQTEIVLVASQRNLIEEYATVLRDIKLKPIVVDVSSLSVYRLLHTLKMVDQDEHLMLLQFDIQAVNVTIFHQDIPQFTRHLKLNLDHDLWEVKKSEDGIQKLFWIGEQEEIDGQIQDIVTEVDRMLNFYRYSVNQGRVGVSKILLTGDYPKLDYVVSILKKSVDLSVEQLSEAATSTRSGAEIPMRFHELVGLALKSEVQ
ncbi:type IV pilus biogenesis protein PilM [Bacillus sp. Marseille-P3661]|uniref:type IV pilus biogenesis protein PilM n=1 Tax=Bacillus sp. Marseille-P3661 TaxID=1936234 RepID=UPI000C82C162|nr:pilus assembly protein PilM [Bacillus sp. Marseille-P3661]